MKENYCLPVHFDFFFFLVVHIQRSGILGKTQEAVGVLTLAPGKQRSLYAVGLPEKSFELIASIIR